MDTARQRGRMILIAYRHGLRASELCALRWDQMDFARGLLHVQRLKNRTPSVHPMGDTEIRALRIQTGNGTMNFMLTLGLLAMLPLSVLPTVWIGAVITSLHAMIVMEIHVPLATSSALNDMLEMVC